MPRDACGVVAVEHERVLGNRRRLAGGDDAVEVEVAGAALGGARSRLRATENRERSSTRARTRRCAASMPASGAVRVRSRDRGRRPSAPNRAGPSKSTSRRAARKCFSERSASASICRPCLFVDRGEVAHQVVHNRFPFSRRRLPIANPSATAGGVDGCDGRRRRVRAGWAWEVRRVRACSVDVVERLGPVGELHHRVFVVRPRAVGIHRDADAEARSCGTPGRGTGSTGSRRSRSRASARHLERRSRRARRCRRRARPARAGSRSCA